MSSMQISVRQTFDKSQPIPAPHQPESRRNGFISQIAVCALPLLLTAVCSAQNVEAGKTPLLPTPADAARESGAAARQSIMTPRFEIQFQDIPVADLLITIAQQGAVEISINGDVDGTLKFVSYKNVTAEEAIERVARDAGLFWGRRGDQYVVARILEHLDPELQTPYLKKMRTAPKTSNSGAGSGGIGSGFGNGSETVSGGFAPPRFDEGISQQGDGTVRTPNSSLFIPELQDRGAKKGRDKEMRMVILKNISARMAAYWLDPAHNAPDFLTQNANWVKQNFHNQETIKPAISPEAYNVYPNGSGRGTPGYPYPGTTMVLPQNGNVAPYGVNPNQMGQYVNPYNMNPYGANPYGNPYVTGNPAVRNWGVAHQPQFQGGFQGGAMPNQFNVPQENQWSSTVTNSNPWGQRPFLPSANTPVVQSPFIQSPVMHARPQFGTGTGTGTGTGAGGAAGNVATGQVFDLPDGIEAMAAIDAQNALLIRGTAAAVEELQQLIELVDQPLKQVEIEAQFVTLTNSNAKSLGINFTASATPFTLDASTGTTGGNFNIGFVGTNFQATLNSLVSRARAKIVTAPRVVAINNLPASIVSQTRTVVLLPQSIVNAGNNNSIVTTTTIPIAVNTSIGIQVAPTINGDGTITVLMQPQVQQQGTPTASNPFPTVSSQQINTIAIVRDGDTIALGGLRNKSVQNTKQKLPFLGNIPIIGRLFQSLDKSDRDEDLIVFLTARIVRRLDDSEAVPGT